MSKLNMPREFYLCEAAKPVDCGNVNVAVYIYDREACGKMAYYAIGFAGKANKPTFNYRFRTDAARKLHIDNFIACQKTRAEYKAKLAAERQKPHSLKIGDVLDCSWGWEQTNVDFYQVTRVIGPHSVEIRKIASAAVQDSTYSHGMADRCLPQPNEFVGDAMVRRANSTNSVKTHASYAYASLWDGKPNYRSWYA